MGFLDNVIRFIEQFRPGGAVIEPEPDTEGDYTRKFVSGLVYCGGIKRTVFAVTFDLEDQDLEDELLQAIESETSSQCSEIRENFGYSEETGFDLSPGNPEYPEITVGFE